MSDKKQYDPIEQHDPSPKKQHDPNPKEQQEDPKEDKL